MPSTYAHYRMGKEVMREVSGEAKNIISAYPEPFLIGLHGPDILFYYKPLKANSINQIGYGMHSRPGKEFFENAAKVVKKNQKNPAFLSYVYGFICHFSLDVTCHGYIDEKIAKSGVSHAEIEVEFDRELMIIDELNPITHILTNHIVPSVTNADVIHNFYQGITVEDTLKALQGMIRYNNLLVAPSPYKRHFISLLLKTSGNYKEMHGLVVNYEKNPLCNDSTIHLLELYTEAKNLSIKLIKEFDGYLNGTGKLNEIYDYTFGSRLLEEEKVG